MPSQEQRTSWDQEATRHAIGEVFGREQLELARPCLRSLYDRQFYAQFHYQRAKRVLQTYARKHLHSKNLFEVCLGGEGDDWARLNVEIRKVGADVVACIQSIHALPDILACAVYYSLQLDRVHLPARGRYVNHKFVVDCLEKHPDLAAVRVALHSAVTAADYKHLAALANQSKHYSIIFPALNEDQTGVRAERHTISIPAFKAGDRAFPSVLVSEFLPRVYEQMSRALVDTGCALLATLTAKQGQAHPGALWPLGAPPLR